MKPIFSLFLFLISVSYNAQTDHLIIKRESNKYGVLNDGKIIVPVIYDSVKFEKKIISAKIDNHFDLYSLNGKIIALKAKKFFHLKNEEELQILNFRNQIEYIENYGIKLEKLPFYSNYGISIFENIEEQIDFKKNIIKTQYPSSGAKNDTLRVIQYEQKIPKRIRLISFMNSHNSQFAINRSFFETLNRNFAVVKSKGKYGVWKYDENRMILSNIYDKIIAYNTHLILEKNGLFTIYPNLGKIPKYKRIFPYEYFFSRFETVDNKKGWVDRNGIEYYDN